LKSSASLSAKQSSQHPVEAPRRSFALLGHSVEIDPRFNAVRRDLADVRLADRVFAPHYAAPVLMVLARATQLRAARATDSEVQAGLASGDVFEVFELAGGNAWGRAPGCGLVGYLDETALVGASS